MKFLIAGAGLAALAAAPATAQYGAYYPPYGGNYGAPYGNAYGYYNNANMTQLAVNQCTAAVNSRLYNRTGNGIAGLIGSLVGAQTNARVLNVTSVNPGSNRIRVRGFATSGRYASSGYGYGYYGALGSAYVPDLRFSCSVDYSGRIRDIDINRR